MMTWLFQPYDRYAYGLFRFIFFMTLLFFYREFQPLNIQQWLIPEFREYFEPISFFKFFSFDHFQVLNSIDVVTIWKWMMLLSALGFLFPVTSFLSFIGILLSAGVMLNFGKVHHVNHMPVFILGIMALSFNPGSYSIDALMARFFKRRLPNPSVWALKTAQIYMCLVYFSSGIQKLRISGLDWIFSDNMQHIILTRPTITALGFWVAQYPLLCKAIAFTTVLADLTAPLALFSRRYRWFVIPTLFMFHIGTFSLLGYHGYFVPYNLCYLVWLPWEKISQGLRTAFLVGGVKLFDIFPFLGVGVKRFYAEVLFPTIKRILILKYGHGFDLILRHSILKQSFNPFLSDIDYTVVLDRSFEKKDELIKDLIKLTKLKIFDYPQIYLREEWDELQSYDSKTHERFQFIWNVRKVGWLRQKHTTDRYEMIKIARALNISRAHISRDIGHWSIGKENFPAANSELPLVCPYIPFLEMTSSDRPLIYDVNQLMFLISLLPGEENWVPLNHECFEFKRRLWTQEYLLSRSHLRLHSRRSLELKSYKMWLRDLEKKYQHLFSKELILSGEKHDMD